jgi:hypothetical protein
LLQAAYEKGNGAKPPTQTVAATVRADRSSPTFSVSFAYDPANPREISDLRFQKKGVTLYDMNADGTFDMRLTLGAEPRGELWYKGKSQEQDMHDQGASAYRRRLVGGEVLLFDMKNGLWRPESEKSAPGKDAPR